MKIVDVEYVANLPLYLHIAYCGKQHRIQLEVSSASQLKTFMRRARQDFEQNGEQKKTIFLGVIPVGEKEPITMAEWERRRAEQLHKSNNKL